MLHVACCVHTWSLWCQFGSVRRADFHRGGDDTVYLSCEKRAHQRNPNAWFSVCMQCLFLAFLLPGRYFFLFCLARAVSCCFPWRNVSVAKETVSLQSLMARVIAGVEQMHMTLAALLRSLGFSVDTAGTWKMYLQLNPVMTWCQAHFYMAQTLTILYKNAIST